jgi:hypothetical protein
MKLKTISSQYRLIVLLCVLVSAWPACAMAQVIQAQCDVRTLGLVGDGVTDDTAALQKALDQGNTDLIFPKGVYLLGTVNLSAQTRLIFASDAVVKIHLPGITPTDRDTPTSLFRVTGDNVTICNANFNFDSPDGKQFGSRQIQTMIYAKGISHLHCDGLRAIRQYPDEHPYTQSRIPVSIPLEQRSRKNMSIRFHHVHGMVPNLVEVDDSEHIILERSVGQYLSDMMHAVNSSNITVRGNRLTHGATLTTIGGGSAYLKHHDNYSSDVVYQCVWRGGTPDPSRKSGTCRDAPLGSSRTVYRNMPSTDPNYNPATAGVYDIQVTNNYAEYGMTLAWGNKGRHILIKDNIARFISDYAYGTEGCEDVIFANNIAINSTAGSIVSMYWGDKLLITGNQLIVRDESWDSQLSWYPTQKQYQGTFIRLHHGPGNKADAAAGSLYGATSTHIVGNLCVNELTDKLRGINIQSGMDVTIIGNKLINGAIIKGGSGQLTAMDNEILINMPTMSSAIRVAHLVSQGIIKNNILKFTLRTVEAKVDNTSDPQRTLAYSDDQDDESLKDLKDDPMSGPMPAINCNADVDGTWIISQNQISGWPQSLSLELGRKNMAITPIVIDRNLVDGQLNVIARDIEHCLLKQAGNMNLNTGQPVIINKPAVEQGGH